VLSELDVVIQQGLRAERIVQLPNGTHYRPIGKKDGSVKVSARLTPRVVRAVNSGFPGRWLNADNVGKSEDEIIALWRRQLPWLGAGANAWQHR